ncbi:MAG: hypothetical protein HeimC2_03430 [Candidatus Heimdallarchaeota archaeon LC_2]|nr:MAG: hypothetical protein HeimC2_03430 [Candidatus Heimdallarchaeota archaeon LC_2]
MIITSSNLSILGNNTNTIKTDQIIEDSTIIIGNDEFLDFSEDYNLPGNGSQQNPFVISNFEFSRPDAPTSPYTPLFYLEGISYHIVITDSIFYERKSEGCGPCDAGFGLSPFTIKGGTNLTILRNIIDIAVYGDTGIKIEGDDIKMIENDLGCDNTGGEEASFNDFLMSGNHNVFSRNCIGYTIRGLYFNVNSSIIENNIIQTTFTGSRRLSTSPGEIAMSLNGNNNIIQDNLITSVSVGIVVHNGLNNLIYNNSITSGLITNNQQDAIVISGGYTTVIGNTISNSYGYGISLGFLYGDENEIADQPIIYNNFINNSISVNVLPFQTQAFDQNGLAYFSSNFWDDHTNFDENQDGIADDPYLIINNTDNEPLINPVSPSDTRINEILNQLTVYKQLKDEFDLDIDLNEEFDDSTNEYLNFRESKLILAGIGLFTLSGIGFAGYIWYQRSILTQISSLVINDHTNLNLKELFNGKSSEFLLIANGVLRPDKSYTSGSKIPEKIFEFKFLMHPVRLSIMKLLVENPYTTSNEIRERLKISWGEFSNHLRNMRKANYIETKDQFIDGIRRQVMVVTDDGNTKYQQLISILTEFITSGDFESYMNDTKNIANQESGLN